MQTTSSAKAILTTLVAFECPPYTPPFYVLTSDSTPLDDGRLEPDGAVSGGSKGYEKKRRNTTVQAHQRKRRQEEGKG